MTINNERFSPIALAVLALLFEAPMHPYRMQQLIKERGKDEVINVRQRASLYQTIDRLVRTKLIAVQETEREEKRPERTIYAITEYGRATLLGWMREMVSTPQREFPTFPAVLAHLPLLTAEDALAHLKQRLAALSAEVERIDSELAKGQGILPRLFLLEMEYLRTMHATEREWVQALVADLSDGSVTWNDEWRKAIEEQLSRFFQQPPDE